MSGVWKQIPFGLVQFDVDYGHRYTDAEITDIVDNRLGRGTSDEWEYLARCATDPKVRRWCQDLAMSAYRAEEMDSFNEY